MTEQATAPQTPYAPGHLGALRRFAVGITVMTVLGHLWFGFEQSYAQPLVALATGYGMQLVLEVLGAWSEQRRPRFAGGVSDAVDFFLSAHISSLSVVMLLYYNDSLWAVAFAAAVAIGSKAIFRAPVPEGTRHFFNPSNFAISATLLLFPSVGLAMPWQFTVPFGAFGDWAVPAIVVCLGCFINGLYNKRLPLVAGFLVGFVVQLAVRAFAFQTPWLAMVAVVTGPPVLIYLFFMLPDPATTPEGAWGQLAFGFSVALVYLLLVALQAPFGLFFALTIVCGLRGLWMYVAAYAFAPPSEAAPSGVGA